jgi:hypothetical protein
VIFSAILADIIVSIILMSAITKDTLIHDFAISTNCENEEREILKNGKSNK